MKFLMFRSIFCLLFFLFVQIIGFHFSPTYAKEEVDPSDPTKIYTYAGGGLKYTDYTNSESMIEVRATGNIAASDSDTVMFELGYGWHDGDLVPGDNSDFTNGRVRWFHLFPMDYSVVTGYRGWATQIDAQVAGALKGTDGQNTISVGALPAFGLNEQWSFFLALSVVNTWDKNFDNYNGLGANVAPLLVYTPSFLWEGAYFQIWPAYTYFVSGELRDEGSGNFDLTTGGPITDTVMWAVTFQKNLDVDLLTFRRGEDTGVKNDWNAFLNITTYF